MIDAADRFEILKLLSELEQAWRALDFARIRAPDRVCARLRRTAAGWRFAQYVESPLAPIACMRLHHERATTPGSMAGR
jgi:hypothetical protein